MRQPTTVLPLIDASTTVAEQIERDTGKTSVAKCFTEDGIRALLVLDGSSSANVLTYQDGAMSAWNCSEAGDGDVVGAIAHSEGWGLVTRELASVSLPGPKCRPARTESVIAQ